MLAEFLIAFRETLEAALIVGIILTFLYKTKQTKYNKTVYLGIAGGVLASILGAVLFNLAFGGFEGQTEEIFEGIMMILGSILITTVIVWMMKHKHAARKIEENVSAQLVKGGTWGIFLLVFVAVLREGIETVIFLQSAAIASSENSLLGILLGIIIAIGIGYFVFTGSKKVDLKKFFTWSSIILVMFAAGLFAHGIHEFEEAKIVNPIIYPVWDLNPDVNPDGSYPILHENGFVGRFFKDLFGYNGNPSLLEVISYIAFLSVALLYWRKVK